ncbi:hypothetical protein WJX72_008253 [[Myrmecia] bisecta]|uniref:Uncharacterized protein n=1 Tax=[Myrmecia] bisecta TaxID=41462 RepID=A0AAW1P8U4_9CHLO
MTFLEPDKLREDGLDGTYYEIWEREPASQGPTWGFRLKSVGEQRTGFLVGAGDFFLFAGGRAVELPARPTLADCLVASKADHQQQLSLLHFELSLGWISGAAKPWTIQLSTLPGRAGNVLLDAACKPADLQQVSRDPIEMAGISWLVCPSLC